MKTRCNLNHITRLWGGLSNIYKVVFFVTLGVIITLLLTFYVRPSSPTIDSDFWKAYDKTEFQRLKKFVASEVSPDLPFTIDAENSSFRSQCFSQGECLSRHVSLNLYVDRYLAEKAGESGQRKLLTAVHNCVKNWLYINYPARKNYTMWARIFLKTEESGLVYIARLRKLDPLSKAIKYDFSDTSFEVWDYFEQQRKNNQKK